MVEIEIDYRGDLHCEAVHGPSGDKLATDAPVDNQGRGEAFSPTDLAATALGTCVVTIMGSAIGMAKKTVSKSPRLRTMAVKSSGRIRSSNSIDRKIRKAEQQARMAPSMAKAKNRATKGAVFLVPLSTVPAG